MLFSTKLLFQVFVQYVFVVHSVYIIHYTSYLYSGTNDSGSRYLHSCRKPSNRKFILLQGKATFHVVHEIINYCTDSDLTLSVCCGIHSIYYMINHCSLDTLLNSNIALNQSFNILSIWMHRRFCDLLSPIILCFILKLFQLAQQTEHRHPIVSCGLFVFNWGLLFNVSIRI